MPEFVTPFVTLGLTALFAYFLGAVPFGILISKIFGLGDIRQIGSGNIGATNVLRTGNKFAAILTLLLDAGKGGGAVLVARATVGEDAAQIAGLFAFLGHLFPIYLRFRGGKGVATFLGTLLALSFFVGAAACLVWLLIAAIFRMSSLSALVASASAPLVAALTGHGPIVVLCTTLACLIFVSHRTNIARLIAGQEPKIGQKT